MVNHIFFVPILMKNFIISPKKILFIRYCDIDVYATAKKPDEDDSSKQTNINIYARYQAIKRWNMFYLLF